MKEEMIDIEVDQMLLTNVQYILNTLGVPFEDAINIYFRQIILHHGIPFEVEL